MKNFRIILALFLLPVFARTGEASYLFCAQKTHDTHAKAPIFTAELTLNGLELKTNSASTLRPADDIFTSEQLSEFYGADISCYTPDPEKLPTFQKSTFQESISPENPKESSHSHCDIIDTGFSSVILESCKIPDTSDLFNYFASDLTAFNGSYPLPPITGYEAQSSAGSRVSAGNRAIGVATCLTFVLGYEKAAVAIAGINMMGIAVQYGVPENLFVSYLSMNTMTLTVHKLFHKKLRELEYQIAFDTQLKAPFHTSAFVTEGDFPNSINPQEAKKLYFRLLTDLATALQGVPPAEGGSNYKDSPRWAVLNDYLDGIDTTPEDLTLASQAFAGVTGGGIGVIIGKAIDTIEALSTRVYLHGKNIYAHAAPLTYITLAQYTTNRGLDWWLGEPLQDNLDFCDFEPGYIETSPINYCYHLKTSASRGWMYYAYGLYRLVNFLTYRRAATGY